MPVRVRKTDGKWIVTDGKRTYGTHPTSDKAAAQARAINANRKRSLAERFLRG